MAYFQENADRAPLQDYQSCFLALSQMDGSQIFPPRTSLDWRTYMVKESLIKLTDANFIKDTMKKHKDTVKKSPQIKLQCMNMDIWVDGTSNQLYLS